MAIRPINLKYVLGILEYSSSYCLLSNSDVSPRNVRVIIIYFRLYAYIQ
jgi:hypothetical protein